MPVLQLGHHEPAAPSLGSLVGSNAIVATSPVARLLDLMPALPGPVPNSTAIPSARSLLAVPAQQCVMLLFGAMEPAHELVVPLLLVGVQILETGHLAGLGRREGVVARLVVFRDEAAGGAGDVGQVAVH